MRDLFGDLGICCFFLRDLFGVLGIRAFFPAICFVISGFVFLPDLFGNLFFVSSANCLGICFFSRFVWGVWDLGICFLRFDLGFGIYFSSDSFFSRFVLGFVGEFGDLFRDLFGDVGIWHEFYFFFATCLGIFVQLCDLCGIWRFVVSAICLGIWGSFFFP